MRNHREQGIALVTTMLILILLSTMIVGVSWLVMGDQKLGGNNSDRQLAFYGAEAGMESLTASLENLFDVNYAPNGTAINALMTTPGPPSNIPNVQYLAPGSTATGSGYQITFMPTPGNANLPLTNWGTIPTGQYAGLVGLMTPYTLTVTARTIGGSEARLQRVVQTVAIPVFQFGYFSQMDLAFFAGPNFNFGGRVHTNGNLWLAEGNGNTLTLSQKVTAAGEIISNNLENGWVTTTNYTGAVNITNGSGVSNLKTQSPDQSVVGSTNYYANIGAYSTSPSFKSMANTVYNNNIAVKETGVQALNLSIATPAIGGQPIDLIRRPQPGEDGTNLGKLQQRYYSEVSLRILLSDYGPSGTCSDSDISSTSATAIPYLATNGTGTTPTPVDLATLAWDTTAAGGTAKMPYSLPPLGLTPGLIGTSVFPLPASDAQGGAVYKPNDGYWVQQHYPIIKGCLKIAMQNNTSTLITPVWTDVTWEILNLGYTGRNINPQSSAVMSLAANKVPNMVALPAAKVNSQGPTAHAGVATVGCTDPSPNAVIRLARLRDNPTSANNVGGCGTGTTNAFDYWPNVLFDTREAILTDAAPAGSNPTLAGAMYYVELDVKNLAKWFSGTIGSNGTKTLATNGFSVYFSDRRGEQKDPNAPASVVASGSALTGGYGYEDLVNNYGCPNATLDQGEDVESDYVMGVSQSPTQLRTYGNILANLTNGATSNPQMLWPIYNTTISPNQITGTELGGIVAVPGNQVYTLINSVLNTNNCGSYKWPGAEVINARDLRENPPVFFRRALKIVNGDTISLGTCNSVPCGLTIVAENPVYVQSCYNNPGQCGMSSVNWSATSVGASIIGDAVTLLSDNWNDVNSFWSPYNPGNRSGTTTTYRMAVAAGKGVPFKQPTSGGPPQDFGTDGGSHNFLRLLESWSGTAYYEGSIVSMYYNHQALGIYKCCTTVYGPPTRGYQFDQNFLTPSLLPPLTPMLRLVNTVGFTQMLLPTQ